MISTVTFPLNKMKTKKEVSLICIASLGFVAHYLSLVKELLLKRKAVGGHIHRELRSNDTKQLSSTVG